MWIISWKAPWEERYSPICICKTQKTADNLLNLFRTAEKTARKFNVRQKVTIGEEYWSIDKGYSFDLDESPVFE